jgi:hypothetical protein
LDVLGLFLIFWEYSRGGPFWFTEFFLEDFSIFFSRGEACLNARKRKKYSMGEKDPRKGVFFGLVINGCLPCRISIHFSRRFLPWIYPLENLTWDLMFYGEAFVLLAYLPMSFSFFEIFIFGFILGFLSWDLCLYGEARLQLPCRFMVKLVC